MYWSTEIDARVDEAVASAASGVPTVLDITGHAGFGKSRLARTIAQRFPRDQVVLAVAYEDAQNEPLAMLQQLGVEHGTSPNALSAARALGEHLDALEADGPVAVMLDDLHWADPESIDAVGVLLERMAGDRVLVVAGHRPVGSRHARWQRRLDDAPAVVHIALDGLDDDATRRLIQESAPEVSDELVRRLRSHTGGSPLFLRSLLHEYSVADLAVLSSREALPASTELASTMRERISLLDPAAVATLSAIAVLGDDGADIATIASVAAVQDVGGALDVLREEQLVVTDRSGATPRVRIFHGVIRAAVYDNIPRATRERMHRAAAARLISPGDRLRHRAAAAGRADDGLAEDLLAFADTLHERARYREAARFRRQAAHLSSSPESQVERTLDADFEAILALDLDDLSVDEETVYTDPRVRLTIGSKFAASKRFVAASDMLGGLTDREIDSLGPLPAYRARVLRAWSLVSSGRSAQSALHELALAKETGVYDPALRGYFALAQGQAVQRAAPVSERMSLSGLLSVDRAQMASTPEGTIGLAWRGAVMSLTGMPNEAIGDLSVVTSRFGDDLMDFTDGLFHALQGFAHFLNGQWSRASIMLDLSRTGRLYYAAPLSAAIQPIAGVIAADRAQAFADLQEARRIRIEGPHPAAIHAGDIVDVLTLYFLGTAEEQAGWLDGRIADLGSPDVWLEEQVPHFWYVAQAIGAVWAGRSKTVPVLADLLRSNDPPPWSEPVAAWLEARANFTEAGTARLVEIARDGVPQVPLLEVMIKIDAARRKTNPAEAHALRSEARQALIGIGADKLLNDLLPPYDDTPAAAIGGNAVLSTLTDRERDVAALLLEGLSYTQISKELFITRSTVAFHLSRVYAKTGTASRHELAKAVRTTR